MLLERTELREYPSEVEPIGSPIKEMEMRHYLGTPPKLQPTQKSSSKETKPLSSILQSLVIQGHDASHIQCLNLEPKLDV